MQSANPTPPTDPTTAVESEDSVASSDPEFQDRSAFSEGWASVGLKAGNNEHNVKAIAQTLRVVRSLEPDAPIHVRDDELASIGKVLDLHDRSIVPLVMRHFSLAKTDALALLSRIHQAVNA